MTARPAWWMRMLRLTLTLLISELGDYKRGRNCRVQQSNLPTTSSTRSPGCSAPSCRRIECQAHCSPKFICQPASSQLSKRLLIMFCFRILYYKYSTQQLTKNFVFTGMGNMSEPWRLYRVIKCSGNKLEQVVPVVTGM